ncbi:unnamed protein product [Rotaria sp. Silwood1]|nr:unnamed protein product [Rotaria sp. Silwood1]CAF1026728.1 unnamed protein product [Rotaria sp. Silwood1]CAF3405660.1 unnamed protein product [Rotaria sp. Silwood1]CAF4541241.1 unnamed protein product [Rotaria sp. Silwood1]CAF4954179.1 unnamed protein product [Rotaria sp. Silwood1]
MNAILGPTGSGKSSLLDILAGRKDHQGLIGQVLIDGQPQMQDFKYRVGYVVQDDMVSGTLTVRENLAFSANVRLPRNVSSEDKIAIVDRVIVQLGLEKCADSRVGTETSRGVSGGERKRTNIGMELVLSPTILFLDEPTTGLANLVTAAYCVAMLVFTGYLLDVTTTIKFLAWIKWVSIFRYASNAITINEFTNLKLCQTNDTSICLINGEDILKDQKIDYLTKWDLWANFVALGVMTLIYFALTYVQLLRMRKTK